LSPFFAGPANVVAIATLRIPLADTIDVVIRVGLPKTVFQKHIFHRWIWINLNVIVHQS